jgi:type VI secretion system protein ImpK
VAGEVFFDRLDDKMRRADSEVLADILEVYLVCLLLGFEGRYSGVRKGELQSLIEKTRSRINGIRQRGKRLTPEASLPEEKPAPRLASPGRRRIVQVAVAAALGAFLVFLAATLHLYAVKRSVQQTLTGSVPAVVDGLQR